MFNNNMEGKPTGKNSSDQKRNEVPPSAAPPSAIPTARQLGKKR